MINHNDMGLVAYICSLSGKKITEEAKRAASHITKGTCGFDQGIDAWIKGLIEIEINQELIDSGPFNEEYTLSDWKEFYSKLLSELQAYHDNKNT